MFRMALGIASCALFLTPTPAPGATPAEMQIEAASSRIRAGSADAHTYNTLAMGFTRRARETGDGGYYVRALDALSRSREVDPENSQIAKIAAWVWLGRHEFQRAVGIARGYVERHPGDPEGLGVLGDALMELGEYAEAEKIYQRMVALRPGPAAYVRVAYWREIIGDYAGALELLGMALAATDPRAAEDRAWALVQIGNLQEKMGHLADAEASHAAALEAFSSYHYALTARARLALRTGRAPEAVAWAEQALAAAPHAERYLILADALRALGHEERARAAEDRFEALALAHRERADNENRELVAFYLERRPDPRRALALARREAEHRQDVDTLARLAWALERNGESEQARAVMQRVLATGVRRPEILARASELGLR